jgi:lactate permease
MAEPIYWTQNYDPLGHQALSCLVAALPVAALLGTVALGRIRVHFAALIGLATALATAILVYGMPVKLAAAATVFGAAYGLFPIGWIILNLIFLYHLTLKKGLFDVLRHGFSRVAPDRRVQVILVAYCLGAFFEGAAGFGTPVAVTAAILIQLGFKPLQASGLSLIANTAPVAYGGLGIPLVALSAATGMDLLKLSAMAGRLVPVFSVIIPFWVVWAMSGFRGMLGVWPAALVAGLFFAIPQFLMSNFHGPWLVDTVASVVSMVAVLLLLRVWSPKPEPRAASESPAPATGATRAHTRTELVRAWTPWAILSLLILLWGAPQIKKFLDGSAAPAGIRLPASFTVVKIAVPALNGVVRRAPPVAPPDAAPEAAVFSLAWLSATGTGILAAALLSGSLVMGYSFRELAAQYCRTIASVRMSLLTIASMLALGYVTKFAGADATLGLALAKTGAFYPFFGTMLGWLGVALTGSDTASNVLFGNLQQITSSQLHISPLLMGAANSVGGVMGKMVDTQSIVVASTATSWYGHEGAILRFVFIHSIVLAALVGLVVSLFAYVPLFQQFVPQ